MTQLNKATLATFFQTNDIPTGSDYNNLIDSYVNQVETATQSVAGPINPTELITPRVSATDAHFTGIVSAVLVNSRSGRFTTDLSAQSVYIFSTGHLTASGTGNFVVSADTGNAYFGGTVTASGGFVGGVAVISAAGTTQATAAVLTGFINHGKGISDGQTTGFTPPANNAGKFQFLFNKGASANLWPPTGGTINGLAANAPFPIAASSMITITHLTASAMAAK